MRLGYLTGKFIVCVCGTCGLAGTIDRNPNVSAPVSLQEAAVCGQSEACLLRPIITEWEEDNSGN